MKNLTRWQRLKQYLASEAGEVAPATFLDRINEFRAKIKELQDRRTALRTEGDQLSAQESRDAAAESRLAEITTELRATGTELDDRLERLAELESEYRRSEQVRRVEDALGVHRIEVTSEPLTYGRRSQHSFFADVFASQMRGDTDAGERLRRHAKEQENIIERRLRAAEAEMKALDFEIEKRDLSRVDGSGGAFVPPLYLVDEFVELARAGRQFADSYNVRPLPPGTDSINVPRITGGTSTGIQVADNTSVAEADMTDATLNVPVRTIAGQQDVAIQLLEQSPIAFDEIVFADLIADYNMQLDVQTINGSGASGQVLGILGVPGIAAVTYTDATPTVQELYPKIADAIFNRIATLRKKGANRIFMHPRRWGWMTSALDSSGRPLISGLTVFNPMGLTNSVEPEGPVGAIQGLPVWLDPNIPTNLGAGTNEDIIIVSRFTDHWLWESVLRTRTLPEVGSGTLTVRMQIYNYVAATAGRYPSGTATIGGTGLITPTF